MLSSPRSSGLSFIVDPNSCDMSVSARASGSVAMVTATPNVPIFVLAGQVAWPEALALGAGFAAGGAIGSRLAVQGGERLIRPVLGLAIVALAGRMIGLY